MAVSIDSANGDIIAGGAGTDGDLVLLATDGTERMHLDGGAGNALFGGNGVDGDVVLFAATGDRAAPDQAPIQLNGGRANITVGGQGQDGDLVLLATDGAERIRLDGLGANLWLGGNGADGDIVLFAPTGDNRTPTQATIQFNGGRANIQVGGQGQDGDLVLLATDGTQSIHLDGGSGDIILANADCAEDFDVEDPTGTEPGTVMVIGDESRLRVSEQEYDRRVAGVIAGGGDHGPGIVLGRGRGAVGRLPVALIGRVLCKVDAGRSGIDVGDLLTTSQVRGHAMKAADSARAVGAIIGKALKRLDSGQGLIPVLVSLQ